MSVVIPATPETIYKAWLNSKQHCEMTGAKAKVTPRIHSKFTAWDEYISGKNLELEAGKRILQSWRTTEFPDEAEDSLLEIVLKKKGTGTELFLKQWNIPFGQSKGYKQGWIDFYFDPMQEYFGDKK